MLAEGFIVEKDVHEIPGCAADPFGIGIRRQRVLVPALVAKPERDIIGELDVAEENGQIIAGINMVRAAPVEYPVHPFGEDPGISHLFYAGRDLVVERELGILKDGGADLEEVVHQIGMHFGLRHEFRFIAKTPGDAMVIRLPEDLGIPVPGNLVKEGQDIRFPLLQLLNKRSGKGELYSEIPRPVCQG